MERCGLWVRGWSDDDMSLNNKINWRGKVWIMFRKVFSSLFTQLFNYIWKKDIPIYIILWIIILKILPTHTVR